MKKINTIKNKLFLLFVFIILPVFANDASYFCGFYYNSDYYYFNLFNQENISQKAFYPFLRIDEEAFYTDIQPIASKNLDLWYVYFDKKYTKKQLADLIFNSKKNDYTTVFSKDKKESKAIIYLKFAKECEVIAKPKNTSWNYQEILKSKEGNVSELLEKGLELFEATTDKQLKIRYAYQIIRLYHYGKMYVDAINFFEDAIADQFPKDEIYYYTLDQLGGCYYKTKQNEKAAYIFLTVFEHSFDRKQSAFTSYKFCTYRNAEGKQFLKTKAEKANQIFITSLRNFSDSFEDLHHLKALGASNDKQELLVMRMINGVERNLFKHESSNKEKLLKTSSKTKQTLNQLINFVAEKQQENSKNNEFWQLTSSYLSFLSGNTNQAKLKLTSIKSTRLQQQKQNLAIIYNVFSWDKISKENEIWLANVFKNIQDIHIVDSGNCYDDDNNKNQYCHLHGFVFKQLSHYYFKQNQLAKAFLLHNYLSDIHGVSSHELIDQLITLVEKPNKNTFEKSLLKSEQNKGFNTATIVGSLKKAKGATYFRSGDFKKALPYLDKNEEATISPKVFSNNIKECFECDAANVMTDEVYKAPVFSFLQKNMNTYSLAMNLKQLETLALNEEAKIWKRKLANYLLGNYFFNVSNTGYYRNINYEGKYWYNFNFGKKSLSMDEIMLKKEDYYFTTVYNSYNNLATKSKAYYKKVITLSKDDELNARCSYMIAKCELNHFYNTIWDDYYAFYEGEIYNQQANEGFYGLKEKYNHTEFYEEIKTTCGFFKYYDAQ